MGISGMGIGLYGQGYSFNPMDRINNQNTVADKPQEVATQPSASAAQEPVKKAPKILAEGQLEDFAFDFKKGKEFSMIGEDSSLVSLDKEGTVADVKKDELLDQYKFFVNGSSDPVQYASEEGSVRRVIR